MEPPENEKSTTITRIDRLCDSAKEVLTISVVFYTLLMLSLYR